MRLRPSGNAGPLAVSLDAFATYQAESAWTWEHLALTRARVVAAQGNFAVRIAAAIRRSEEHTSELQSLMRTSYAVFCLKKKTQLLPHLHHTDPNTDTST